MPVEESAGGTMFTGDSIEHRRWLTVRSALRIEIKTGMSRSRGGRPTVVLANEISGGTHRTKIKAYEDLNKFLVEHGFEDKPL